MAIVNETSQRTTDRSEQRPATPRKLVVFHLAGQAYGLDVDDVQEILPLAELSRPPLCPPLLAGFVNIGSEPTPVIRLTRLFELPDSPPELYTPMLLLRTAVAHRALLVDRVSEIITLANDGVAPVGQGHSLNDCVTGVVRHEDTLILLLSAQRLLLEQEQQCLEALEASERSRLHLLEGAVT